MLNFEELIKNSGCNYKLLWANLRNFDYLSPSPVLFVRGWNETLIDSDVVNDLIAEFNSPLFGLLYGRLISSFTVLERR